MARHRVGQVMWVDLTVKDAAHVRDFYQKVVGWNPSALDMGGYSDFNMIPPDGRRPVAGICHARRRNAKLPPQWLIYVAVKDLEKSLRECRRMGGKVLRRFERYCLIEDPAGAVMMIYMP